MIKRRHLLIAALTATMANVAGPALALLRVRKGVFKGRSGHQAAGGVRLEDKHGEAKIKLSKDFQFSGAPDAWIALGRGGVEPETAFAKLQSNTGAQSYKVPGEIDALRYGEVWIWSKQHAMGLAVAKLK